MKKKATRKAKRGYTACGAMAPAEERTTQAQIDARERFRRTSSAALRAEAEIRQERIDAFMMSLEMLKGRPS